MGATLLTKGGAGVPSSLADRELAINLSTGRLYYGNSGVEEVQYLPIGGKAADSNLLDGLNSTHFVRSDTYMSNSIYNNHIMVSDGGSGNRDYIRHDDSANAWHFVSDAAAGAQGNSKGYFGSLYEGGTALASKYAAYAHTHATAYAALNHTHPYASSTHNHDSDYLGITAKAADSNLLDGIDSSYFEKWSSEYSASVAAGWITIANFTGARGHAEFYVYDTDSGKHAYMHLDAWRSYQGSSVTVLNAGGHTRVITGARVIEVSDTTYGNKKLQVYVNATVTLRVREKNKSKISGYTTVSVVTPVNEGTPSGYTVQGTVTNLTDERGGIGTTGRGYFGSTVYEGGTSLSSRYAAYAHTHAADYAALNHTHPYASSTHNHDSDYADISHDHNSDYLGILSNAYSASKLVTARTISLTGDATGSASFNGTANATITVVIADDSHNHIISNIDGLQTALDGKQATHTHPYLNSGGGTLTGNLTITKANPFLDIRALDEDIAVIRLCDNEADTSQMARLEYSTATSDALRIYVNSTTAELTLTSAGNLTVVGTVQGRNMATDGSKLDGIATGATNTAAPYYTSAIGTGDGKLTTKNFTQALYDKLVGVATGANLYTLDKAKVEAVLTGLITSHTHNYNNYSLPTATASVTGGVKIGSGVSINAGVISVSTSYRSSSWLPTKANIEGVLTGAITSHTHAYNNYVHPTTTGNKHIPSGGSAGQFLKYSASGTAVWASDNNTVYTHPTTAGNKHIPSGGSAGQFLKYSASGTAVWASDNNTTYSVGDGGLTTKNFTQALYDKLVGVATGANLYVLTKSAITTLLSTNTYAAYAHTHAVDYAALNHTHPYASSTHNHDADYADISHNHDSDYLGILSNAYSASKLVTARTISLTGDATGSASFNGTANATITVVIADDSHTHSYNSLTSKPSIPIVPGDLNWDEGLPDSGALSEFVGQSGGDFGARSATEVKADLGINDKLDASDAEVGWHGSATRIKILPQDFQPNDDNSYYNVASLDNGGQIKAMTSSLEAYVAIPIPTGYKATQVRLYGNDSTNVIGVYEGNIASSAATSKLPPVTCYVNTTYTLSPAVTSSTTNYLIIKWLPTATTDYLYGGYVTIAKG